MNRRGSDLQGQAKHDTEDNLKSKAKRNVRLEPRIVDGSCVDVEGMSRKAQQGIGARSRVNLVTKSRRDRCSSDQKF